MAGEISNRIHLVNIQQKSQTQDPVTGTLTDSWVNLHTNIFASISPVSVRNFIQSQSVQSDIRVMIEIDYISGLDESMRIVGVCGCHSGVIYNPEAWLEDPDTGQDYLTAPCSKGVNEG